jgi:hypothetical protein
MQQDTLSLFGSDDDTLVLPLRPSGVKGSIEARFEAFHRHNPHVYASIVEIALDLKSRGFQKGGMKMIFERLRWLYALRTRGDSYKLNNYYTAYYARLVMATVPSLAGFFEVRLHQGAEPYVPDLVALGFTSEETSCPS